MYTSMYMLDSLRDDRSRFGIAYRDFVEQHSLDEVGLDREFFSRSREKSAGRKVSLCAVVVLRDPSEVVTLPPCGVRPRHRVDQ